jgi:hypothetical protein
MNIIKDNEIDLEKVKKTMDKNGFCFFKNLLDEEEIQQIQEDRDEILSKYSEHFVQNRLFYKRENAGNKQGDAVMVAFENNKLPYLYPKGSIGDLLEFYNSLIGKFTGEEVSRKSRSMFNAQDYFENSRPCGDHQDGEHLEYTHNVDSYGEYTCQMEKGILPRYVIVFILTNENEDGQGTYIREHDSETRIDINARAGDCFIFDNIRFRHGVPSLEEQRSIVGFRNFDMNPVLFQTEIPEEPEYWTEVEDPLNPGWRKSISTKKAKEEMLKFNKKWKEEIYDAEKDKLAAF